MKTLRTLLLIAAVCAVLVVAGCVSLPALLSALNPGVVYRVPDAGRVLYLTLDDGPSDATSLILDVLRKHDVKATFFITTDHIRPELMQRLATEGHQVANHLKTTASLDRLPQEQFELDFQSAESDLAPYEPVKLFRPPGGFASQRQKTYAKERGYRIVVGTVYPLDHWLTNATAIRFLTRILVIDGGIIILHDTNARGPRTAEVLNSLIPELKRNGYEFRLLPANLSQPRS
jgi:peptidoglycan-N-acetylglucosamine deacetylase